MNPLLTEVSPQLRDIGKTIAMIGREIEESQVEDGDPPFEVSHNQFDTLGKCAKKLKEVIDSLATRGHEEA